MLVHDSERFGLRDHPPGTWEGPRGQAVVSVPDSRQDGDAPRSTWRLSGPAGVRPKAGPIDGDAPRSICQLSDLCQSPVRPKAGPIDGDAPLSICQLSDLCQSPVRPKAGPIDGDAP
eukprot:CAMPEP_0114560766 /NCGR_PEP_ID=MMETSP0114-20121206/11635_1 /TAXON_ID=31324 /ORGANISM="Goniomonas sp, Strain m" /LENGTH=116 /DNA_ID=CAMNT_0001746335 /DNA_START=337 /DNA_END=684 /DNA_ORIENTATION=+